MAKFDYRGEETLKKIAGSFSLKKKNAVVFRPNFEPCPAWSASVLAAIRFPLVPLQPPLITRLKVTMTWNLHDMFTGSYRDRKLDAFEHKPRWIRPACSQWPRLHRVWVPHPVLSQDTPEGSPPNPEVNPSPSPELSSETRRNSPITKPQTVGLLFASFLFLLQLLLQLSHLPSTFCETRGAPCNPWIRCFK